MRYIYISWIFFFKLVCCELEVRIADGILRGQILQSRDGRTYYSFTGIPYAKQVLKSNIIFNIHYTSIQAQNVKLLFLIFNCSHETVN
jgi:hypothetical protein